MMVFSLSSMVLWRVVSDKVPVWLHDSSLIPCMLRLIWMENCIGHNGQIQSGMVLEEEKPKSGVC